MIRMVQLTSLDSVPGHVVDQNISSEKEKKKKKHQCVIPAHGTVCVRQVSRPTLQAVAGGL